MKIINSSGPEFGKAMRKLSERMGSGPAGVAGIVEKVIGDVRKRGDAALFRYTKKFDNISLTAKTARISDAQFERAFGEADPKVVSALKKAAVRIRAFHRRQREKSWSFREGDTTLGQIIRPLASAGVYVPGGKASYPSTALMNAIPARIAGVERVVMVSPAPNGEMNPHTLVAAKIAGVDEAWKVGGAQAVAALAYGTKSIRPVDKIVGPGNVYVAEAKRQVFGKVDIDMIAGPSEILVLADGSADPAYIAADLLSQAEHDENAYPILVTTSRALAERVGRELENQTRALDRQKIIRKCLRKNCYAFVTGGLNEAFDIANEFAPEHMELAVKDAGRHIGKVKNAGALFVGHHTPEALGDYCAGPNHVLPTGGTARFSSPLGVYDFVKKTSLLSFGPAGLSKLSKSVTAIAREEGLAAHARAVEIRVKK